MEEKLTTAENPSPDSDSLLKSLEYDKRVELTSQISAAWEAANAARTKWMADKKEGLDLYWGIRPGKDFPFKNCANLHVPLMRTIMDTVHSNLMGSFDAQRPVSAVPVGPEDVPKSKKTEKMLNWQFTTQVDFGDISDRSTYSALQFGIAPLKIRYVIEKQGSKKIKDGLEVELIQPERFLTPPDAADDDIEKMDYVIHEITLSKSDIKKRMNSGLYEKMPDEELGRIGEDIPKNKSQADEWLEEARVNYSGVDSTNADNKKRPYGTIIEYYGLFDYKGDGIERPILATMLLGRKKLLRVVKWERSRPFALIVFSYVLGRATGESVPDMLKQIAHELNTIHNQKSDAVTISNIPFFFFDPVAGFNPNNIKLAPGVGIPVNGNPTQAVYFPPMNTTHPEMYREEENLFLYAERMLGAGANVQGILQSKRATATEISTVDRRAGIRFLTIFDRIKKGFRRMFQIALEYDREFMPKEVQVRIGGLDSSQPIFEAISREDLNAQVDIVINGTSILDVQAEKQEVFQAYQLGMTNPLILRNENAVYELTKDLFAKLNVKRIDAYLQKPEDALPKTPQEEHNLFMQEEYIEPHLAENIEDHIKQHALIINDSEKFKLLSKKGQTNLIRHYASTLKMQQALAELELLRKTQMVNDQLLAVQAGPALGPSADPRQQEAQQTQQARTAP